MTKADIFKLTLALYRVTALFPKKEPLKFALRHKALKIFSSLSVSKENSDLLSRSEKADILKNDLIYLDSLKSLFRLAKEQEWIDNRNFSTLDEEYQRLGEVLRKHYSELVSAGPAENAKEKKGKTRIVELIQRPREEKEEKRDEELKADLFLDPEEMSTLEKKIIETLKEKGKLRSSQLSENFPDLNRRSIQRRLNELKNKKLVEISRSGRETFYFHKG